jgi:aminoglycoside/choline kinase family phosphotransferase
MSNDLSQGFTDWILAYVPAGNKLAEPLTVSPLKGDAGFRRYYRLNTQPSLIAVNSPPSKEKNEAYVDISLAFKAAGIRRPSIRAVDFSRGFLLLEDFGDQLVQSVLTDKTVEYRYQQAESTLLSIQQLPINPQVFKAYDADLLSEELDLFQQWFVKELLGVRIDSAAQLMIKTLYSDLICSALEQPKVIVHRDYHSRNLMILNDDSIGVIDFQDAVYGPITYDLVSLLRDCYVRWPMALVQERTLKYKQKLEQLGLVEGVSDQDFLRWFDLMGLQRHLKVMGIFSRLALRDQKVDYLNDLSLVIAYSLEVANLYPETREFGYWFKQEITPWLLKKSWYKEWSAPQ